jgi:hypothetical protein
MIVRHSDKTNNQGQVYKSVTTAGIVHQEMLNDEEPSESVSLSKHPSVNHTLIQGKTENPIPLKTERTGQDSLICVRMEMKLSNHLAQLFSALVPAVLCPLRYRQG